MGGGLMELFVKGGVLMIPLALCSVVGLAVFIERLLLFARTPTSRPELAQDVGRLLARGDAAGAFALVGRDRSLLGRLLDYLLAAHELPKPAQSAAMVLGAAVEAVVKEYGRFVAALALIANIAPVLGLLGTVFGMIRAFMAVEQMGARVDPAALAGGIWEALITTAVGLCVALPATIGHSYLSNRVETVQSELYQAANLLVAELAAAEAAR
ncbi:MAG: MotA/TolQ/ExbB proton channel family protein [Thermodesulfobacteriota bacterium]